jgi:hypothetical protein
MRPFHLPALEFLVFRFCELEAVLVVLELEGDAVELDFCDDSAVFRGCGGMFEDSGALVEVLGLDVDCAAVCEGGAVGLVLGLCFLW